MLFGADEVLGPALPVGTVGEVGQQVACLAIQDAVGDGDQAGSSGAAERRPIVDCVARDLVFVLRPFGDLCLLLADVGVEIVSEFRGECEAPGGGPRGADEVGDQAHIGEVAAHRGGLPEGDGVGGAGGIEQPQNAPLETDQVVDRVGWSCGGGVRAEWAGGPA